MRYVLDTNVLLRYVDRRFPGHSAVHKVVNGLQDGEHELTMTAQNCIEFWNVATRPADKNGIGLSVTSAEEHLQSLEQLFPRLLEEASVYTEWRRLVVQYSVSGAKVHDTRLVATMPTNQVSHILTFNGKDFKRFAAEVIVPVDPASV